MPCRINKRRLWASRILLESYSHDHSAFVTLTYDQDHCPYELSRLELSKFMRRLRKEVARPLRFFGVGEYGDQTWRPHYHVALYGLSVLEGPSVEKVWPYGFVHMGELNEHTANYIGGYVCKKMTNKKDPRLQARHPEFAQMSRRPGIGASAATHLGQLLTTEKGSRGFTNLLDVPASYRVGGVLRPLGTYLRRRMRVAAGGDIREPAIAGKYRARVDQAQSPEDRAATAAKRKASAYSAEFKTKLKRRSL